MSHTQLPAKIDFYPLDFLRGELRKGSPNAVIALLTALCFFGLYFFSFIPHEHGCAAEKSDCAAAEIADCPLCYVASHHPVSPTDALNLETPVWPRALLAVTTSPSEAYSFFRYLLPPLRAPPAHLY